MRKSDLVQGIDLDFVPPGDKEDMENWDRIANLPEEERDRAIREMMRPPGMGDAWDEIYELELAQASWDSRLELAKQKRRQMHLVGKKR